jgi:hypothetical protein
MCHNLPSGSRLVLIDSKSLLHTTKDDKILKILHYSIVLIINNHRSSHVSVSHKELIMQRLSNIRVVSIALYAIHIRRSILGFNRSLCTSINWVQGTVNKSMLEAMKALSR